MDCQAPLVHGIFPGKNTGVDCHALLQGIFLTQGENLCLLHCKQILYHWAIWEAHEQEGLAANNTNTIEKVNNYKCYHTDRRLWQQRAGKQWVVSELHLMDRRILTDVIRTMACVRAQSLQLYLPLCNPMDYSPPGSSGHGILQARILEWVAMPSCRGSSQPRDGTPVSYVSCIGRWVLYH